MTSICPEYIPKTCQPLFTGMDRLAVRWQLLAPTHCRLSLLDLNILQPLIEQAEALSFLTTLLSPAETVLFRRFRYAKRRLEWLGGRLAAKHCLQNILNKDVSEPHLYDTYSILPDTHGRPHLAIPLTEHPAASISISHSRGYAAALVHQSGDCGIDIQQKTPKLISVQERFTSDDELRLLHPITDTLTRLALLWAAKEAIKKCLLADHPSFFGTIKLAEAKYEPSKKVWTVHCRLTHPAVLSATVRIAELDEHLIACASGEPNA